MSAVASMRPRHILQIAYYDGLLSTRAFLLESWGYRVTSVCGNENAMKALDEALLSSVDLCLIGFCAPLSQRTAMLHWLKRTCPRIPVVVLQSHSAEQFPAADGVTMSEDPELWRTIIAQGLLKAS
jgi:DNA-binding NtrC family response regulator